MQKDKLIELIAGESESLLIPDEMLEYLAEKYLNFKEKTLTFEQYAVIQTLDDKVKVFAKMR